MAVHPAYDSQFDAFAPKELRGNPAARQEWAVQQMEFAARASRNLGLDTSVSFTGALAFPYLSPWPQRPAGLIEEAFGELARRWRPILDVYEEQGVDVGYEIHPGEDVFDGATTFEMFLEALDGHKRCTINYDPSHFPLQQLEYLPFIDIYHERISAFHVNDAEFNPDRRQGVYSGYQGWVQRAGCFQSLGDGQVDFSGIFSKMAQYDYDSWAVLEWECCLKHPEQGAVEEAPSIADYIIRATETAFDDFAGGETDRTQVRQMLGLQEDEMVSTAKSGSKMEPVRLGMVGGGQGAFIGAVHRIATRMDGDYELVAGALSSDPDRARASGAELGLAADRSYRSYQDMAKAEAARDDGIEAVAIVTPNHVHFPVAKAFLWAGIHVICDKPLTSILADAKNSPRWPKTATGCSCSPTTTLAIR